MAFTPFRPGQQSTQIQVIELQQTLLGALSGLLRLANGTWLTARNAANTADVNLVRLNASNQIELGTSLVRVQSALASDVTCTNANTYYDGPSVTLAAGTWLLMGSVKITSASGDITYVDAKLWDGNTNLASSENTVMATGQISMALMGVVVCGALTTCKISVASSAAGALIKAATSAGGLGSGNNASTLWAVKIG